jgi:hypothetical protein
MLISLEVQRESISLFIWALPGVFLLQSLICGGLYEIWFSLPYMAWCCNDFYMYSTQN